MEPLGRLHSLPSNYKEFSDLQQSRRFWSLFLSTLKEHEVEIRGVLEGMTFTGDLESFWQKAENRVILYAKDFQFPILERDPKVLNGIICLDEIGCLDDSPSLALRRANMHRASRVMRVDHGNLCVMIDTLSDFQILRPEYVPSARLRATGCLVGVFYNLNTQDINVDKGFYLKLLDGKISVKDILDPNLVSRFGKPLWGATFDQLPVWSTLLELAKAKLLGSSVDGRGGHVRDPSNFIGERKPAYPDLGIVACLASTITLDFRPYFALFNMYRELIRSHQAHVCAIDTKSKALMITYPSDPVLALASHDYIFRNNHLNEALSAASLLLNSLHSDKGERGELAAQLLLLQAADTPLEPMTLESFLANLGINDVDRWGRKCQALKGSFVNLTHFIKVVKYTPNVVDLMGFFARGAAVVCKNSQSSIDIMIPIVCKDSLSISAPDRVLSGHSTLVSQIIKDSKLSNEEVKSLKRDVYINCSDIEYQQPNRTKFNVKKAGLPKKSLTGKTEKAVQADNYTKLAQGKAAQAIAKLIESIDMVCAKFRAGGSPPLSFHEANPSMSDNYSWPTDMDASASQDFTDYPPGPVKRPTISRVPKEEPLGTDDEEHEDDDETFLIKPEKMSYLLVQVKNHQSNDSNNAQDLVDAISRITDLTTVEPAASFKVKKPIKKLLGEGECDKPLGKDELGRPFVSLGLIFTASREYKISNERLLSPTDVPLYVIYNGHLKPDSQGRSSSELFQNILESYDSMDLLGCEEDVPQTLPIHPGMFCSFSALEDSLINHNR